MSGQMVPGEGKEATHQIKEAIAISLKAPAEPQAPYITPNGSLKADSTKKSTKMATTPGQKTFQHDGCGEWSNVQQRYFYEYLRISGDRPRDECCKDIAHALHKPAEHVTSFYEYVISKFCEMAAKSNVTIDRATLPIRRLHKRLINLYEHRVIKKEVAMTDASEKRDNKRARSDGTAGRATKEKRQRRDLVGILASTQTEEQPETSSARAAASNPTAGFGLPAAANQHQHVQGHEYNAQASQQMDTLTASLLEVTFCPANSELATAIESTGSTTTLNMTLDPSTPVLEVMRQLKEAWPKAIPSRPDCQIFLQGSSECPPALRGMQWGSNNLDNKLSIRDLLSVLQSPNPATVLYSWDLKADSDMPDSKSTLPEAHIPSTALPKSRVSGGALAGAIRNFISSKNTTRQTAEPERQAEVPVPEVVETGVSPEVVVAETTPVELQAPSAQAPAAIKTRTFLQMLTEDSLGVGEISLPEDLFATIAAATAAGTGTAEPARDTPPEPASPVHLRQEIEAPEPADDHLVSIPAPSAVEDAPIVPEVVEVSVPEVRRPVGLRALLNPNRSESPSPAKTKKTLGAKGGTRKKAAKKAAPAKKAPAADSKPASAPQFPVQTQYNQHPGMWGQQPQQQQQTMPLPGVAGGLPASVVAHLNWHQQTAQKPPQVLHSMQSMQQMQHQEQQQHYQQQYLQPNMQQYLQQQMQQAYLAGQLSAPQILQPQVAMQHMVQQQQVVQPQANLAPAPSAVQVQTKAVAQQQQQQQQQAPQAEVGAPLPPSTETSDSFYNMLMGGASLGDNSLMAALHSAARDTQAAAAPKVAGQPEKGKQQVAQAAGQQQQQQQQQDRTPSKLGRPAIGDSEPTLPLEKWACLSPPSAFKLPADFNNRPGSAAPPAAGAGVGAGGSQVPLLPTSFSGLFDKIAKPRTEAAPEANIMHRGVEALFQQVAGSGSEGEGAAVPMDMNAGHVAPFLLNGNTLDGGFSLGGMGGFGLLVDARGDKSNSNWLAPFEAAQGAPSDNQPVAAPSATDSDKARHFAGLFGVN